MTNDILGIDQFGEKYLFKNKKRSTIKDYFGYNSCKPIYRDLKDGSIIKIGYYLSCRGLSPLWIELFTINRCKF